MLYQLAIGVSGLVLLTLLYVVFQELAKRMRAMRGECQLDSIRCLGCLASGHCRAKAPKA
jgi:hypothetical protein